MRRIEISRPSELSVLLEMHNCDYKIQGLEERHDYFQKEIDGHFVLIRKSTVYTYHDFETSGNPIKVSNSRQIIGVAHKKEEVVKRLYNESKRVAKVLSDHYCDTEIVDNTKLAELLR